MGSRFDRIIVIALIVIIMIVVCRQIFKDQYVLENDNEPKKYSIAYIYDISTGNFRHAYKYKYFVNSIEHTGLTGYTEKTSKEVLHKYFIVEFSVNYPEISRLKLDKQVENNTISPKMGWEVIPDSVRIINH